MSRNGGESRIPLPRTVRPSLLPKLRSLGPPKIGNANHRRHSPSGVYCAGGKPQQQPHYVLDRLHRAKSNKQLDEQTTPSELGKEDSLSLSDQADLSISAIWNAAKDNKDAELLMRLSDEQLSLFRSQEELAQEDSACLKRKQPSLGELELELAGGNRPQQHEEPSSKLESPLATAPPHYLMLQTKQNSFEHDESSLGILTPDQMTDFTVALESSRTPSCENLSARDTAGNFLLSKSNALVAAAARHLDIVASVPGPISPHDRSPSFEELPLDPRPVLVVNDDEDSSSLCAEDEALAEPGRSSLSAKTSAIDSSETSAAKPLPTSFVTSVTSITSLEAGYQGDGENSRPASRGPEPLSLLPSALGLMVGSGLGTHVERNACKQDPMTDSDFFTESDADEVVRSAGDRRAQVIDGTLFCAQPTERRCPGNFEPAEEMDSSGIYSDLDKRQDSSGLDLEPEPEEPYGDGDHATDTADTGDTGDTGDTEISVRSQPSPQQTTPAPALVTNNMLTPDVLNDTLGSNSTASTAEVTVIKCQKDEQNAATRTKSNSFSNKENSAPLKKYKMPKRNVISKIKTMIEANRSLPKIEAESEPKRVHRQQRKNGRWDAVMNQIEAGKQRGRALKKEVKSRVLQGLPNSATSSTASTSSTRRGTIDTTCNNKDKRRMRGRPEKSSSNQELVRTSSLRSSASDLSSTHSKEALKRPSRKNCTDVPTQLLQPNNNQISSNLTKSKSNLSTTVRKAPSIKSVQSVTVKQKNTTTNRVTDRLAQPPRAHPTKQLVAVNNNNNNNNNIINNSSSNNHSNNNNNNQLHQENESNNNNNVVDGQVKARLESREQQVQTEDHSQDWSNKAANTVQALAITVQYFTHQLHLEDLSGSRLRQQLDTMKTEWLTANSELEELRLDKASIEEALNHERHEHLHHLQNLTHELEQERTQRSSLEKRLQEERRQIERLQGLLEERQREEKSLHERLQAEHALKLHRVSCNGQQQQQQQQESKDLLAAEVESLRTVLEIRSQENGQLRAEVDLLRRDLDDKEQLRLKCDSLEARCEDLKAQLNAKEESDRQLDHENQKLLASIHQLSKQNKRLSQRNEELLWRLRQKNEVVSVLTNQLTPQSQQRLSKSLQPSASSSQLESSTCSMKYMVEKGDSVSWTLDISDGFETCHSQSLGLSSSSSPSCYSSARRLTGGASNGLVGANRARSNSTSVVDRPAKSPKTGISHNDDQAAPAWKPSYQSTPLQRRRNDHSWSLSNTLTETVAGQAPKASSAKAAAAVQISTDDDDEEEDDDDVEERQQRRDQVESLGQRPQEAGGEAMISEETSTSSSSEDDESSVSSGDIP